MKCVLNVATVRMTAEVAIFGMCVVCTLHSNVSYVLDGCGNGWLFSVYLKHRNSSYDGHRLWQYLVCASVVAMFGACVVYTRHSDVSYLVFRLYGTIFGCNGIFLEFSSQEYHFSRCLMPWPGPIQGHSIH